MIPISTVLLLSGGLDSVTLLYDLKQQGVLIHALGFNYCQNHLKELYFAKLHCRRLNIIFTQMELPELGGLTEENWIIPNRNCILLSMAVNLAVKAKADTVTIGCNKDDADYPFPDCSKDFISAMNVVTNAAGINVEICAPYIDRNKAWIGGMAREMGIPSNEVWTCYKPKINGDACGICPACKKLKLAMP